MRSFGQKIGQGDTRDRLATSLNGEDVCIIEWMMDSGREFFACCIFKDITVSSKNDRELCWDASLGRPWYACISIRSRYHASYFAQAQANIRKKSFKTTQPGISISNLRAYSKNFQNRLGHLRAPRLAKWYDILSIYLSLWNLEDKGPGSVMITYTFKLLQKSA